MEADQVYFDDPAWDEFSESALDFIEYVLTFDEQDRPTAAEALQHEWLQQSDKRMSLQEASDMSATARSSLESLKKFHAADSKLKQCTYSLIASQIVRKEEKEEVDRMFHMLDKDSDGKIGVADMKSIYFEQFGVELSDEEVSAIIHEVNLCGSGSIAYSEFVIASLKEKGLVSDQNLELAFQMMDKNSSGFLTAPDLTTLLGVPEDMEDYVSRRIIKPADKDGDGKISLEDFKAYFEESDEQETPQPKASRRSSITGSGRRSSITGSSRRRSSCGTRASVRKSFRASTLFSEVPDSLDPTNDFHKSISLINAEPNFRNLLTMFEGNIEDNHATVPSLFHQK